MMIFFFKQKAAYEIRRRLRGPGVGMKDRREKPKRNGTGFRAEWRLDCCGKPPHWPIGGPNSFQKKNFLKLKAAKTPTKIAMDIDAMAYDQGKT